MRNDLALQPSTPSPHLVSALTRALQQEAVSEARGLTVTRDAQGCVRLHGNVRPRSTSRPLESVCWASPGVTSVANLLHLEP